MLSSVSKIFTAVTIAKRVRTAPRPIRPSVPPAHERLAVARQEHRARELVARRKRCDECFQVRREVLLWRRNDWQGLGTDTDQGQCAREQDDEQVPARVRSAAHRAG